MTATPPTLAACTGERCQSDPDPDPADYEVSCPSHGDDDTPQRMCGPCAVDLAGSYTSFGWSAHIDRIEAP